MKRKESTLTCMKHFRRTAIYDTRFFELLLKDARDNFDRYGSVETQFVVVSVYGRCITFIFLFSIGII